MYYSSKYYLNNLITNILMPIEIKIILDLNEKDIEYGIYLLLWNNSS